MVRHSLIAFAVSLFGATFTSAEPVSVRIVTADNVTVFGSYYPCETKSAPAIVLLHSLGRSRQQWADFAGLLQPSGIAALAIDLRGHGDSTRRVTAAGVEELNFHTFRQADLQDMLLDVEAAVDWLQKQPTVNRSRIGIIGSSISANVALRYATVNDELAALVLLSPGINYRGLRSDDAMKQLRPMPLRIVTAVNDSFAYESCGRLRDIHKESGASRDADELWVCGGNAHGADLLLSVKNLPQVLLAWLKHDLLGTPLPPPPVDSTKSSRCATRTRLAPSRSSP